MATTKATVRRRTGRPTFIPAPVQRIGNKNMLNRRLRNSPFKIENSCHKQNKMKLEKMA